VIVVSSGAIALGRGALKLSPGACGSKRARRRAVGQVQPRRGLFRDPRARKPFAAQVLLTLGDTEERDRYLNARATLKTLLSLGSVPVINENDTVATAEIRYGDNDRLAARASPR
jgi:glutamate 5-kinase